MREMVKHLGALIKIRILISTKKRAENWTTSRGIGTSIMKKMMPYRKLLTKTILLHLSLLPLLPRKSRMVRLLRVAPEQLLIPLRRKRWLLVVKEDQRRQRPSSLLHQGRLWLNKLPIRNKTQSQKTQKLMPPRSRIQKRARKTRQLMRSLTLMATLTHGVMDPVKEPSQPVAANLPPQPRSCNPLQ